MSLLAAKIVSTIVIVLGLSGIAERAGPALAGTLAGLPLGVAIVFFFIGIEQGPMFIADAAAYTIGGFAATLCFNLGYWLVSSRVHRHRFASAIGGGLLAYLIAAVAITQLPLNVWTATLLVAIVAGLSILAMRGHENTVIGSRVKMTWLVVAARAGVAVGVVVAVTGVAAAIGPRWSGLLAGFPIMLFPLLIILQFSYSPEDAYTVIKSFPYGLPSLVVFVLCAWAVFVPLGVPLGFVVSLLASMVWLAGYFVLKRRMAMMRDAEGG
ncbi:hypothetical protein [Hoeflea poritis]|uniref:Permease n=1 Tax=Hoeflea poritis TaxID=2993659 RepID=A0ABT4VI73_9HYPH|nr:hypothetical protein [Hoeflea poritis]MDA4844314.1 hypothetical protein [Hoeflea poritis]